MNNEPIDMFAADLSKDQKYIRRYHRIFDFNRLEKPMANEPVDIGTPYVTREDMQDSINELYVRVDHLQRTVDKNNEKVADMEKALALFVELISDKLGIEQGEKNG